MELLNFENDIDTVILKRGKDYFEYGHVESIEELDKGFYTIEVMGSQDYTVNIHLDGNQTILDSYCDCPYDLGDYCKHEVAAFYALRSSVGLMTNKIKTSSQQVNKKDDLKTVLSSLDKEILIEIIMEVAQTYPQVKKKLLFNYTISEDEILASKNLVNDYINRYKRYGYIDWKDIDDALYGAELTLQKVREKINANEIEKAVLLCFTVLSSVIDMLDYCDDSDGIVSGVIYECLELINEAVSFGLDQMNDRIKGDIFLILLNESLHKRYNDPIDWRIQLLKSAVLLCDTQERRVELEKQLDHLLKADTVSSWSSKYTIEQVKLLQLDIIQKHNGKKAALSFIQDNINIDSFRKLAIEHLLKSKNYNEVLRLCMEGRKLDKEYRGLVTEWKKFQLLAYEGLGDTEKQKDQLLEFLYENRYEYYAKLKGLYKPGEWEIKLQEILETYEKEKFIPSAYVEILKEEGLIDKILAYCQKNLSAISTLYPYIIESFEEETNNIYMQFIENEAVRASNRSNYRQVCGLIKQYKKVSGKQNTRLLVEQLKQQYKRRPAFIDELNTIK